MVHITLMQNLVIAQVVIVCRDCILCGRSIEESLRNIRGRSCHFTTFLPVTSRESNFPMRFYMISRLLFALFFTTMLLTAPLGIAASLAVSSSSMNSQTFHHVPSFVRPVYETMTMMKKSATRKVESLPMIFMDDLREETLFTPLYNRRTHYSYSLTSNTSKRKASRQDKRARPLTLLTHISSASASIWMALVISLVAKLVVYPTYFASFALSNLR